MGNALQTPGPYPGRLLGIDFGSKVIGVAASDLSQTLAHPVTRVTRSTRERDFAALRQIVQANGAVAIIVGLPRTPEGFSGKSQAPTVQNWARRLAGQVQVPVYLWDETLSTFEAQEILAAQGASRSRVDDVAAAVILQTYLDARKAGVPVPPVVRPRQLSSESPD